MGFYDQLKHQEEKAAKDLQHQEKMEQTDRVMQLITVVVQWIMSVLAMLIRKCMELIIQLITMILFHLRRLLRLLAINLHYIISQIIIIFHSFLIKSWRVSEVFFLYCSNTSRTIYLKCDIISKSKQLGLGITVFLVSLISGIAGSFFFHIAFQSWSVAIAGGIVWFLTILHFNKLMKSCKGVWMVGITRFSLAIVLAFIVSIPFKMKFIEPTIKKHIEAKFNKERAKDYSSLISLSGSFAADKLRMNRELDKLKKEKDEYEMLRDAEEYGVSVSTSKKRSSGVGGKGKKHLMYQEMAARLQQQIDELKGRIIEYEANYEKSKKEAELHINLSSLKADNSFLSQFNTMIEIANSGNQHEKLALTYFGWGAILIFLLLEVLPLIFNFLLQKTMYDEELAINAEIIVQTLKAKKVNYEKFIIPEVTKGKIKAEAALEFWNSPSLSLN